MTPGRVEAATSTRTGSPARVPDRSVARTVRVQVPGAGGANRTRQPPGPAGTPPPPDRVYGTMKNPGRVNAAPPGPARVASTATSRGSNGLAYVAASSTATSTRSRARGAAVRTVTGPTASGRASV